MPVNKKPAAKPTAKPANEPRIRKDRGSSRVAGLLNITKQQLLNEITNAAVNGYRFYVYTLTDSAGVFYIGKGTKGRLFNHVAGRETDSNKAKQARLRAANDVRHDVIAYFNDEGSAYRHEASLIRDTEGLTNIALGDWVEPIERARMQAQDLLARLIPFKQWAPTAAAAVFQKITGAVSLREQYDNFKAEILKQIESPAPTSISFDGHGNVKGLGYNERRCKPFIRRRAT